MNVVIICFSLFFSAYRDSFADNVSQRHHGCKYHQYSCHVYISPLQLYRIYHSVHWGLIIKEIRYLNIPNTFVIQKIELLKVDLLSWVPVEFSTYHPFSSCFYIFLFTLSTLERLRVSNLTYSLNLQ